MDAAPPAEQLVATQCQQTVEADDLLRAKVSFLLRSSGYRELSRITCGVADGNVALYGKLPSYHLKQQAQTLVMNLDAVKGVDNLLEVERG